MMHMVVICQKFSWDYDTYQKQPRWFISLIKSKLEIDSDNITKQSQGTKKR